MYGGATKAVMNLLEGEVAKSIQPLFILPSDTGIAHTLRQKGIPYEVLTYRMSVYPPLRCAKDILLFIPRLVGRIFVNWTAAKQLYSIAKEFKADIIHTNTSVNNIGYVVSRRLNIPHVWHIREYADLDFNLHYIPSKACFLKKLKEDQSYTICITKDIQKYNNLHNWPSSRVIYDGVLSKNQSALIVPKQPYFLFAGRLEQGKGIEDLLEAYAIYVKQTDHPVPLWIAGDTQDADYKKKLERMASSIDGTPSITFLGMREDILSLMQHTLALIVPQKRKALASLRLRACFPGLLSLVETSEARKSSLTTD
jgi:glycosyltransferase involved in cell wall biosynthesis